ncbi:MAG: DUF5060 domain-containing protein [Bacteroidales bacterium]|nr:DUF5060 domain-containing protein [Bacteroidales bacterium]
MKNLLLSILAIFALSTVLTAQPSINGIFHRDRTVEMYDRVEIILRIDAEYENPFDPEDLDIMATFVAPSGKSIQVPGFYTQSGYSPFRVRFSADETGEWNYSVKVRDRNGETTSENRSFRVLEPKRHGPIEIAENKRYLQYRDGTPWYGVGMWYNGESEPEVLDELQEKGANFISHLIQPLETRATGLGRYDQLLCEQIDELLFELEEREMQLALNFWFHSFLSETIWPGGNRRWETNPYQLVTDAKDFYSSEDAWEYQEKLYRYMIARWGYSSSLAIWFIVDEVNGTDGWAYGDSIGAAKWVEKVHNYFRENDPWQHLTTGTRSGGVNEWWGRGYAVLDFAGREIYEAQGFPVNSTGKIKGDKTHPLTHSYMNYHGEVAKLWKNFEKPAIIPETGWDHTFYEMEMPGYQAQYHNAMWVSLASGAAMSPFWWSYSNSLNDNTVTYQLRSLNRFTKQVPFSELTNPEPIVTENDGADIFAVKSDQMIFGWAVDANTDMSGKTIVLPGIKNGDYRLRIFHTWRGEFLNSEEPGERARRNDPGLSVTSVKNKLEFTIPVLKISGGHAGYIGQDVAFIIEPEN